MPRRMRRACLISLLALPSPAGAQAGSPAGSVPVAYLAARRQALLARLNAGVAIIKGAAELSNDPPNSDYPQATAFRQDNDFFYLTGLETKDSWLIVTAGDSALARVQLFVPPRNPGRERWTGPALGRADLAAASGIPATDIHSADSVQVFLRRALEQAGRGGAATLWIRHTEREVRLEFLRPPALPRNVRSRDLLPVLASLRVVKDAEEIRRLSRAAELTAEGHVAAMLFAKPGVYEYEIEAVAERVFRQRGAERLGYPSIVGSGSNSTVLHYDQNRRQTRPGDLIVMDMGAEFGYYAADVTRTIPVSGTFTARQRAIYELVLGSQQAALDAVKPGVTLRALDAVARRYMAEHSGSLCGAEDCTRYFVHELSHWIGMDVHDVGGLLPLAPGMVFTVEPGIYLPDEALGVRIEDDVLVTADGYLLLSKGAPRLVADLERLMASAGSGRP